MGGMLDRLENKEAVLLMYLAGELSEEDRAEVERMLAGDPSLRAAAEELRAAQETVQAAIDRLDDAEPLATEAIVRRTVREMRRYRLAPEAEPAVAPRRFVFARWPVWARVTAAAAACVVLALGLWGVGLIDFPPGGHGPITAVETTVDPGAALAARLERSFQEDSTSLERAELEVHAIRDDDWFFRYTQ